jgi:hypothetical protein
VQPTIDLGGVAADAQIVAVSSGATTVVYDAKTGAKRWEAPLAPASDTFAVRIVDGVATGVSGTGAQPNATLAFDASTGAARWTNPGSPVQKPEPVDGNLFVDGPDHTKVEALDPGTGKARWSVATGGAQLDAGPGLVLLAGGVDATAAYRALDPATGRVLWTQPLAGLQLPAVGASDANGATVEYQNALPTRDGVFLGYGYCLGS